MKNKKLLISLGLALIFAAGLLFIDQGVSSADDDCQIVRLISRANQDLSIDPKTIVVDKGTCIVWFNKASRREAQVELRSHIEIVFEDGKKVCEDVVEATMDFEINADNCLITKTHVPPFGTASLNFNKPGTFDYVAKVKGQLTKAKGQIIVK